MRDREREKERKKESIPFVVHQIWIQGGRDTMPGHIQRLTHWIQQNVEIRGGVYRLWSEADVSIPSSLLPIYQSCPNMASKSDILRLLILYQYGGMYLDTDMILTQPEQLEWLISSSKDVDLALPYLWEHDDDVFFGLNMVSMLPYNNCVLAAPVKSPVIAKILQTVEQAIPFTKTANNPFQWTLNSTGPVMIQKVIAHEPRIRLIPRSLIQQAECVKPAQMSELHKLCEKYPTSILLHGQDRSWFPTYWLTVVCDRVLSMCAWARRRSTLMALIALILFCVVMYMYMRKRG